MARAKVAEAVHRRAAGGVRREYKDAINVLFPGEEAIVSIYVDASTGEQTSRYDVGPSPGFRAWLRRLPFSREIRREEERLKEKT